MEANFKLDEASYFLEKLKKLVQSPAGIRNLQEIDKEFMYNLSAFISAWRSFFDVLLYDYAEKFFEISREEKLDRDMFKLVAIASRNQKAKEFINWYNQQMQEEKKDPLWKKRPYNVHRGRLGISREHRPLPLPIVESTSVTISPPKKTKYGTDIDSMDNREMRFTYFFNDTKDKPVVSMCEQVFNRMKKILGEALMKF